MAAADHQAAVFFHFRRYEPERVKFLSGAEKHDQLVRLQYMLKYSQKDCSEEQKRSQE